MEHIKMDNYEFDMAQIYDNYTDNRLKNKVEELESEFNFNKDGLLGFMLGSYYSDHAKNHTEKMTRSKLIKSISNDMKKLDEFKNLTLKSIKKMVKRDIKNITMEDVNNYISVNKEQFAQETFSVDIDLDDILG